MAREHGWSELRVGIISGAAIAALAIGILVFARVGALHGDRSRIVILTNHAPGVLPGTEVWVAGEKVGLVETITLRPVSTDTSKRVGIRAEILDKFMPQIRKTAHADIRPGGNLIGSPVVYISSEGLSAPPIKDGDTITTRKVGVIKDVGENVSELVRRLTVLADSGSKTVALLSSEAGAVGAFGRHGLPKLASVGGTIRGLLRQVNTGDGSAGLISRGDLGGKFRSIMASKDSITAMMTTGDGNLGRFHRDSTLGPTIARLRAQLDSLRSMTSDSTRGIGRLKSDSTMSREMAKARAQLDSLMKDIKKHPRKYL
ncbi:MAG TPA: MlaD family protein [Gemmatimonadaceae bacterium]|nr:MlaD family protein [Gemmatimonadaceae bacterium]